jgi:hypothetical protein
MMVFHTPANQYFTEIISDGNQVGTIQHIVEGDLKITGYSVQLITESGYVLINKKLLSLSGACSFVRDEFEVLCNRYKLIGVSA